MTIKPKNSGRRTSGMAVENSVITMQYTANSAMKTLMTVLRQPVQMRVLDSRSYLRMTSSRSASAWGSTAGAVSGFFLNRLITLYTLQNYHLLRHKQQAI